MNSHWTQAQEFLSYRTVDVHNNETALEAMLFAMATRGQHAFPACHFIHALRMDDTGLLNTTCWEKLTDTRKVTNIAYSSGVRFCRTKGESNFKDIIAFSKNNEYLADYLLSAEDKQRKTCTEQVKHVGPKTFSLAHQILGGSNFAVLDSHALKFLVEYLKFNIDAKYYVPHKRGGKIAAPATVTCGLTEAVEWELSRCLELYNKDYEPSIDFRSFDAMVWLYGNQKDPQRLAPDLPVFPFGKLRRFNEVDPSELLGTYTL